MKAVNLIPRDSRRGVRSTTGVSLSPTYALLGALALVLLFVTIYALTNNTISSRQAKVATLKAQLAQQQQLASTLSTYTQFEKLAQTRAQTVRQIAASRFDWYGTLSDLSKVVPANTSLESLYGSVAPGVTIGSGGAPTGGSASSLRSDLSVPALELTGCTKTQDDVARLISRLRVINGVTRVTLGDSQKPGAGAGGTTVASGTTGAAGCGPNAPTFDLVVFFQALPGGGLTGATSGSSTPAAGTTTAAGSSTPAAGTTTTAGSSTPASGTSATSTTPVAATTSTTSGGSK